MSLNTTIALLSYSDAKAITSIDTRLWHPSLNTFALYTLVQGWCKLIRLCLHVVLVVHREKQYSVVLFYFVSG